DGLSTGRRRIRDQLLLPVRRRGAGPRRDLGRKPSFLSLAKAAREFAQVVQENVPQPGAQLGIRAALKAREVALRFQEGLLHQIGGAALGPEILIELLVGHAQQVGPAGLEGLAQRVTGAGARRRQPGAGVFPLGHAIYLSKSQSEPKRTVPG